MNEIERQMQAVKLRDQAATIAALRAEARSLRDLLAKWGDDINDWIAVNPPIIGGLGGVGRTQVQKVIDDRRRALGLLPAEAAPAAPAEEAELKLPAQRWTR